MSISAQDRTLIEACQGGLPFVPEPYAAIAEKTGMDEAEVIDRLAALKERGIVRRIGIAPNHYKLGMTANGMTVWDVCDDAVQELGPLVGAMEAVTHCYIRPRALPIWPYNLFAMVHGASRDEVEAKRAVIAELLGDACRASDILYSTAILKKTGLRLKKGAS
ncbi:Lrp/AsnC family transcriptional regulator [Roseovarius faecimaris]|uniref:siroheme decarboxylase n=1 Tax=Roseovarius faecimaris TaxID=2494550 RepID=A0A6I6IS83_9RHOB|nr:Lrp/AsnC family transcriptional regulator [Roseovarius faecimaris]QGX98367.1 Lrp/AsnC family transcriptional regulator [Roseovarius faecimaris]